MWGWHRELTSLAVAAGEVVTGAERGPRTALASGGQRSGDCLNQQDSPDGSKREVNVLQKSFAVQAMIDDSAEEYAQQRDRQGDQVVMADGGNPKSREPVASHANDASGQEVSLEGRAEVGTGPAPHGSVNHEWRTVHAVGSA